MAQTDSSTLVLITGANQGIGFAAARKLAKENRGWHILIGSRDAERGVKAASELKEEGHSVEPLTIDITSDQSIEQAAELVKSKYGRIDVLINNAGIYNEGRRPGWTMREVFQEQFNTNVFGQHLVTEAFEPLLVKSTLPLVVFNSAILGSIHHRLDENDPHSFQISPSYRSSKAALNMIMAHWAFKHKNDGWKVNCICPGYVATSMTSSTNFPGIGTVESGTIAMVKMATLDKDGPTGTFSDKEESIPW